MIAKSVKVGDRLTVSNEGPNFVYLTSDTVGKDNPLPAKAFLSWSGAKNGEQVSVIVQEGHAIVSLDWIGAASM